MLGSAWTFWGTIIRKLLGRVGGQAERSRSASSSWSVARSSLGVVAEQVLDVEQALGVEVLELDLGALAEPALDRLAVEVPNRRCWRT